MSILLNGRAKKFASFQPQQSEISWFFKNPNTIIEAKNYKCDDDTYPKLECKR